MSNLIKVFVGADRSQNFAAKVLEFSIKRHTKELISVFFMDNLNLPQPSYPQYSSYTNFSFTRFAIPKLCDYQGHAIYMDADMLVFKDIKSLWDIDFADHKLLIQKELPSNLQIIKGRVRKKQTAVMLLNCQKLDWNPIEIIANLGYKYSYKELMSELCILNYNDIGYKIPFEWNSIEHKSEQTCLLHYTDIETQPWVSPFNPNAKYWIDEVLLMLAEKYITRKDIEKEIDLGYLRPSLLYELGFKQCDDNSPTNYHNIDMNAGYVQHKQVMDRMQNRHKSKNIFSRIKNKFNIIFG